MVDKLIKNRDFWVMVVVIILGLYSGFFSDLFNPVFNQSNMAKIEIDYDGRKRAFEGEIIFEMSVLDALLAASRGGNFEVRYAIIKDATDILKINGLAEDGLNGKNWDFYLNGQKINADGIHKVRIKSGDKILVRFE